MLKYFVYFKQCDRIYNISNFNHRDLLFRDPLQRSVFRDLTSGDADRDTT